MKAAEASVVEAEKVLAGLALSTQAPFMDGFNNFFTLYSICRLQYDFGGSLQGEDINTIFSSLQAIKDKPPFG